MTFYLWNFMYNILGILLIVIITIVYYKVFIVSKSDIGGTPRTA